MKAKNYYYLNRSVDYLNYLAEEYRFLGRECRVIVRRGRPSELVVYARVIKTKKVKEPTKNEPVRKAERKWQTREPREIPPRSG